MKIDGWRYYNHAAVPTTAPHENANMNPIKDKSIWKIDGGKPLLARWISEFDCGYETNWWYVIKDGPFEIEMLNPKARKHIRQATTKVNVKRIDMSYYAEELTRVHNNACKGYSLFTGEFVTEEQFKSQDSTLECWGAFSIENSKLVGYMTCIRGHDYVETITAKYDPYYLKLRASDAIHYTILDYYLNVECFSYVCSGSRTVNHISNAQEYKILNFGFRKAYCRLHMEYNPFVKWIIKGLFPFRRILYFIDTNKVIHQINAIMKMEEFSREN